MGSNEDTGECHELLSPWPLPVTHHLSWFPFLSSCSAQEQASITEPMGVTPKQYPDSLILRTVLHRENPLLCYILLHAIWVKLSPGLGLYNSQTNTKSLTNSCLFLLLYKGISCHSFQYLNQSTVFISALVKDDFKDGVFFWDHNKITSLQKLFVMPCLLFIVLSLPCTEGTATVQ